MIHALVCVRDFSQSHIPYPCLTLEQPLPRCDVTMFRVGGTQLLNEGHKDTSVSSIHNLSRHSRQTAI